MKCLIGYTIFWIAVGLAISILIKNLLFQIFLILFLLLLGYHLFLCD